MFIMLGGVDLDVTFYRKLALGKPADEALFFEERGDIYRRYAELVLWAAGEHLDHLCILAPQLTPLRDHVFVRATAQMAKVDVDLLQGATEQIDCSHRARCVRQRKFNDALQQAFVDNDRLSFHRIDLEMTSDGAMIGDVFCGPNERDHHANAKATLPLWEAQLQDHVPRFKKAVRRREAAM